MTNLLDHALEQITPNTLKNLENGDEININSRFNLYKYLNEEYYVLIDKKLDEQTFCVQFNSDSKTSIIITDFYGYSENENFNN